MMSVAPPSRGNQPEERIPSIDAMRTVAILAVVAIHSGPFGAKSYELAGVSLGDVIDLLARFAVPFFLITAGFLVGKKYWNSAHRLDVIRGFSVRLLGLIGFWYAFYLIWPFDWSVALEQGWARIVYWNALALFGDLSTLLAGPRAHLWFLPALLIGVVHVCVIVAGGSARFTSLYFAALYLLGLGQGAYGAVPALNALGGWLPATLMTSPLVIAIGLLSAKGAVSVSSRTALVMFALGTASTVVEAWALLAFFGVPLQGHDFLLGTPLQAFGLLCLLRQSPRWGALTPLPAWGRYTLGIYAGHVAVVELLGARAAGGIVWELVKTPLVYALTLVTVVVLARWKRVRPFMV